VSRYETHGERGLWESRYIGTFKNMNFRIRPYQGGAPLGSKRSQHHQGGAPAQPDAQPQQQLSQ
jgi:hypothetical protein